MEITDRELLAICNLSNLKMEFADVVKEKQRVPDPNNSGKFIEKILSNHTIYSLLLQEVEAIKSNTESKRIFLMETEDKKNKKIVKTPIYKNIIDLKKKAGIVYEYCEKFSFDKNNKMHPGNFTNEWEILGAYDGYEIIKSYLDLYKKYLTEVFVSEDGDIYFYSDKEKHELRKLKKKFDSFEDEDIEVCSQSEKEKIEKSIKETSEIKLYPTREELEEKKELEEKMKIILNCIDLASIILPAFKSQIINIPTAIRTAKLTGQSTIKLVRGLFTNVHNPWIVNLNKVLGCSYRSLRSSYLSIGLVDIMYGILKSKRPQVYLERVLKLIIKDFKTNLGNILTEGTLENIFFNLPFATYFLANKITTDIFKKIADDKTLSQKEKNILNEKLELIQKTLKFQTIGLSDSLDITQEGFGVMVLINRSTHNIVICFKNADADTRNNIEKLTITNELFLLKIFDRFLFPNLCQEAKIPLNFNLKLEDLEDDEENKTKVESKDIKNSSLQQTSQEKYKVTITGFDYGADLADLYFYSDNNLDTYGFEKSIKTFKTTRNKLAISLSTFSLTTFGAFIGKEYKSLSKTFFDAIDPITFANEAFLLLSLFFPIIGGATYLTGTLIFKYQILKDLFEQYKTNNTLGLLYSKVCEYGFLECKYYSECQKERFLNCRIAEKELNADEDEYFPEIRDVDFEKLLEGDIEIKGELETDFIFSPNSEIKKFSLYFDEKDYLELENNDNYRRVLLDNNIQLYEKVMVQTILKKYVKIFKIRKKDYIFLMLDLLLQNRKNYFEKIDNNVYIGGEIKSISSDDYLYEEKDLPLNNKNDDELTKFYEIFNTERNKEAQNRKYQTFERQKMVRDYYKIILENDGKINLEKFIQITYIYIGYGDEIADTLYVLKQHEQKVEFDLEGFYETFRLIKNISVSIKKQLENMSYLYLNDTIFYSNRLYDIKNISMITGNLWYKFWVYIQDDGNMRIFNNKVEGNIFAGYVLNLDINKQYIGSFFRSAMTKIFMVTLKQEPDKSAGKQVLKNYYYPQEPKFYTEEGESSFSQSLNSYFIKTNTNNKNSWDEDELVCRTFVARFDAKSKAQLNKEFVELLKANIDKLRQNTIKEQEDTSDSKARYILSLYNQPNFNYLDRIISLLEEEPNILEDFYEIEKEQQNGLEIYQLVIGHFSKVESKSNGEKVESKSNSEKNEEDEKYKYNKKVMEYIYNDDEIKRGFLRLKAYMPNYSEESFEIETDKYILVEGAELNCTEASIGEMLPAKNIIKINGKKVATLADNKTGEQIKTFGYCEKKRGICGGECINWEKESKAVYLGKKVLTTESKGTCSVYGGKISVVTNGTKKSIKVN